MESGRTAIGWAMRTGIGEKVAEAGSSKTLLDRLAIVVLLGLALLMSAYALVRPDYNWDMVAYVATALEDRHGDDPAELHAETWKLISEGARESQLYSLQYGNAYNRHQWENPADFQSQLSMYRVKVGYVWMLRALEPVTGLVNASLALSILPAFGLGLLFIYWLWRENALQGGLLLAPLLALADYTHMTTAVTPDVLAALISLGGIFLLARGRDAWGYALLLATIFFRPDNIVLIFAVLLTAVAFGWRLMMPFITFLAALVACMAISKYGDHPGWWAHFYFSCVHIQNSMADFHPPFDLMDAARGYFRGLIMALMDNDWPSLLALLAAGWALLHRAGRIRDPRANALVFALAIGALGKFASFPLPDDRFYLVFMAGMAVLLVTLWKPRFDVAATAGKLN
jgi:hypothetical protein